MTAASVGAWPEPPATQLQPHQGHWSPKAPCEAEGSGAGRRAGRLLGPGGTGPKGAQISLLPFPGEAEGPSELGAVQHRGVTAAALTEQDFESLPELGYLDGFDAGDPAQL